MSAYRKLVIISAVVLGVPFCMSTRLSAQSEDQNISDCEKVAEAPQRAVEACTEVLATPGLMKPGGIPLVYYSRGLAYSNLGKYSKALADLDEAIKLKSGDASFIKDRDQVQQFMIAAALADQCQNKDDALEPAVTIKACTTLIQSGKEVPKDLAIDYYNRSRMHHLQADYAAAITDLDEAVRLDPKYALAYSNRGYAYYMQKNYSSAIADYNEAVRLDPKLALAFVNRGLAYADTHDDVHAIADYEQVLRLDPKYPAAYYGRGAIYLEQKDYTRAIADFAQAIQFNPKYTDAYISRGVAYTNLQNYNAAIADYSQALQLDPKYALAFRNRGIAYADLKDYAHALADYNEAIRLDPTNAWTFVNRGIAYKNQNNYPSAMADYEQAIRLDSKNVDAYYFRGLAYEDQKNYLSAMADYDRVAQLDPSKALYQNGRCWTRAMANREFNVARMACDEALRLVPNDDYTLDSRGLVGLKQGRFQDAWNDFNTAVKGDATYASYIYGRGIASLHLGRTEEGNADIARAMALDSKIAEVYAERGVTSAGEIAIEVMPQQGQTTAQSESDAAFQASLTSLDAGQLFARADELDGQGKSGQARITRRVLIARFPDSPLAATAAEQLAKSSTPGWSDRAADFMTAALGFLKWLWGHVVVFIRWITALAQSYF